MSGRNILGETHLFDDLAPAQIAALGSLFIVCEGQEGELIFEQGQPAEFLYILLEGEVAVLFKPDDGPPITVARVRPEGVVGWSAVLGRSMYNSAAFCEIGCRLVRISGRDLRRFCDADPHTGALVLERLATLISERLRNTHTHVLAMLEQGLRVGVK